MCATSIEAYRAALNGLRKRGVLLVVGLPAHPLNWTPADLVRSGVTVIPSRVSSRDELRELLLLAVEQDVHCHVRSFRMEELNQVMELLEKGDICARAVVEL